MNKKTKIYTKTGDTGETSLGGGTRVPKFHARLETFGTVDELNSYIGLIRDHDIDKHTKEILLKIQDRLFTTQTILADESETAESKLPDITKEDIELLETEIDTMSVTLPELKTFILPGGNIIASHCHVARCICRRAERKIIFLQKEYPIDEMILQYLNRLSDYLFVLARKIVQDNGGTEVSWKAKR